jgi:hypothetical protein
MPYNPLAEMVKALFELAFSILFFPFKLFGFGNRARGGRQLGPYEQNRQRAAAAAFVAALCVYLLQTGGWPLNQLPPWVPTALQVVAGAAGLLVLAGVIGARGAPDALRDPLGMVLSLVMAGGGYALLQWEWYVPRDYVGADLVSAYYINRLLPGVYMAAIAAGLARALICLQPFGMGGKQQLHPYEIARRRAVGAAFVLAGALYVLNTGQWLGPLLGPLAAYAPPALIVVAGLSLWWLAAGLWGAHKFGLRDPHGAGVSLVAAAVAVVALWRRWQMPPGPVSEFVNRLLPGLYMAVLIAALVRALICAQLVGGAGAIIARALRRRARAMGAASSSSGFWAEMRESFERGRTGRAWLD